MMDSLDSSITKVDESEQVVFRMTWYVRYFWFLGSSFADGLRVIATMVSTTIGVVILTVVATAVIWRVKSEYQLFSVE